MARSCPGLQSHPLPAHLCSCSRYQLAYAPAYTTHRPAQHHCSGTGLPDSPQHATLRRQALSLQHASRHTLHRPRAPYEQNAEGTMAAQPPQEPTQRLDMVRHPTHPTPTGFVFSQCPQRTISASPRTTLTARTNKTCEPESHTARRVLPPSTRASLFARLSENRMLNAEPSRPGGAPVPSCAYSRGYIAHPLARSLAAPVRPPSERQAGRSHATYTGVKKARSQDQPHNAARRRLRTTVAAAAAAPGRCQSVHTPVHVCMHAQYSPAQTTSDARTTGHLRPTSHGEACTRARRSPADQNLRGSSGRRHAR